MLPFWDRQTFFLVGEIPFDRAKAINLVDTTGLDAALGLDHLQDKLEFSVKGWTDPNEYFSLFANSIQVEKESHAWFRAHVVTSYDDHDHASAGTESGGSRLTPRYRLSNSPPWR